MQAHTMRTRYGGAVPAYCTAGEVVTQWDADYRRSRYATGCRLPALTTIGGKTNATVKQKVTLK